MDYIKILTARKAEKVCVIFLKSKFEKHLVLIIFYNFYSVISQVYMENKNTYPVSDPI